MSPFSKGGFNVGVAVLLHDKPMVNDDMRRVVGRAYPRVWTAKGGGVKKKGSG